jgi:septal ring factor EnvC (AmiA/AmiB activator)
MKTPPFALTLPALVAMLCCSCGDDPKMVEKRNQQQAEITRLKGEIALIEEKLKSMPPDVGEDLEAARKRTTEQTATLADMEKEIAGLEARKRAIQTEFDSYRAKYQLK